MASISEQRFIGRWLFEDVKLPLEYSGGLIVAQGFITSLYVHMAFHPAWQYEEVHELVFESGKLKSESDLSIRMVEVRDKIESEAIKKGKKPSINEIEARIDKCFRRDYTK